MNNNKTAGFTFIETLAAIILILLISTTAAAAFMNSVRNNKTAYTSLREAWLSLYCDQKIRDTIEPVVLPYWENSITSARILCGGIKEKIHINGVEIIKADILIKNGAAWGLTITYRIPPGVKTYTTAVLFTSMGDGLPR